MKNSTNVIYNVKNLLGSEIGTIENKEFQINNTEFDGIIITKPFELNASLMNLGNNIIVNMKSNILIKSECSKCSNEIDYSEKLDFDSSFSFNCEDIDSFKIINNTIDLWPALRQEIIINIPIRILCENCI